MTFDEDAPPTLVDIDALDEDSPPSLVDAKDVERLDDAPNHRVPITIVTGKARQMSSISNTALLTCF